MDANIWPDTGEIRVAHTERWSSTPDMLLAAAWLERNGLRPESLLIAACALVVAWVNDADSASLAISCDGSHKATRVQRVDVSLAQDPIQLCRDVDREYADSDYGPATAACDALLTITSSCRPSHGRLCGEFRLGIGIVIEGLTVREVAITYDPRITATAMVRSIERGIIRAAACVPTCPTLSDIEWLSQEEYQRIVYRWNATRAPYNYERCLHWLFEEQAQRTPDAVALEFHGQILSYFELEQRSRSLACELRSRGVDCDVLVPLCAERSVAMVIGILGILRAGGAYVPIDPRSPDEHTARVLENVAPELLVIEARWQVRMARFGLPLLPIEDHSATVEARPCLGLGRPDALACVIHTSGSTGLPKGTLLEHRALLNNILWLQENWPLGAGEAVLQKTPFTFDVSIKEFLWPLCVGGRLVMAQPGRHLDMPYLGRLIQEHRVAVTHFVPSILQSFLTMPGVEACVSIRLVMCGAEVLSPEIVGRFFSVLGAKLLHLYGPTEAAISVTGWVCDRFVQSLRAVPLGRPMSNVHIYLLNRAMQPVPPGVPGELFIGGVALARGYLRQPQLTQQCFVDDPFAVPGSEGRLYRTGDRARYTADGVIEFLGRFDRQVKINGTRIEPEEIEITLRKHPALDRAAVAALADGHGRLRLVAYVVCKTAAAPSPFELHRYCTARLPAYMVPSAFVALSQLPLLVNGKVDYAALPVSA